MCKPSNPAIGTGAPQHRATIHKDVDVTEGRYRNSVTPTLLGGHNVSALRKSSLPKIKKDTWTGSIYTMVHMLVVYSLAFYVTWVLLGIVAFVSHLGEQAPWLAPFLPAAGQTMAGGSAGNILEFLRCNIPGALVFVLPHSLLRPQRLYGWFARAGLAVYDRLAYNVLSAISLHRFLCNFVGLRTPVVMWLPLPELTHLCLSGGCLIYAGFCFISNPRTATLLGVSRALRQPMQDLPRGMDAITWMALCVWERGGTVAFVLFTGVSILPPELTLGDAVTRGVAALYLRARSKAFCEWVRQIEGAHEFTWILRAGILLLAAIRAGATPGKTRSLLRLALGSSASAGLWLTDGGALLS